MTHAEWISKALGEVGDDKVNALFEFGFAQGTSDGTFTVSQNGMSSVDIDFPPSAEVLKDALCDIPTIGQDGVIVTGAMGGPYRLEMVGGNAGQQVPAPVISGADLVPTQVVQVVELRQGRITDLAETAQASWDSNDEVTDLNLRYLYVKRDLIEKRLGLSVDDVDTRTGRENVVDVKSSQRYKQLQDMMARVEKAIQSRIAVLDAGMRRTYGGALTKTTPNGQPYGVLAFNPNSGRYE
jgi:hypothetical protein